MLQRFIPDKSELYILLYSVFRCDIKFLLSSVFYKRTKCIPGLIYYNRYSKKKNSFSSHSTTFFLFCLSFFLFFFLHIFIENLLFILHTNYNSPSLPFSHPQPPFSFSCKFLREDNAYLGESMMFGILIWAPPSTPTCIKSEQGIPPEGIPVHTPWMGPGVTATHPTPASSIPANR